jgi:quercetin dioxygenase-like cupin family protein
MAISADELDELNRQTFDAEAREPSDGWKQFLEQVLADDFVLRRSRADLPNESKPQMLERIASADYRVVRREILPKSVKVWVSDAVGVVVSTVRLHDASVNLEAYQNVKVFQPGPGSLWRCHYWQVSAMPPPASGLVALADIWPMKISREAARSLRDPSHFQGDVHTQEVRTTGDGIRVLAVFFSRRGRTRPHRHASEQVLSILDGEGVVSVSRDDSHPTTRRVREGEIFVVPPKTWHWHGATQNSAMTHLSVRRHDALDTWTDVPLLDWDRYPEGAV